MGGGQGTKGWERWGTCSQDSTVSREEWLLSTLWQKIPASFEEKASSEHGDPTLLYTAETTVSSLAFLYLAMWVSQTSINWPVDIDAPFCPIPLYCRILMGLLKGILFYK